MQTDLPTPAPLTATSLPQVGAAFEGGTFCGLLTDKLGQPYLLVLLAEKPGKQLPWAKAIKWAKEHDADLPNRVESAMLFAHLGDQFDKDWHWTNEQHASDASCAWYCLFDYGLQYDLLKSYEGCARAVRRLPLQSFNPFEGPKGRAIEQARELRATAAELLRACDAALRVAGNPAPAAQELLSELEFAAQFLIAGGASSADVDRIAALIERAGGEQ